MFGTILAATDGSGTAAAAVAHAAELARSTGAGLIVVSAYKQPDGGAPPFTDPQGGPPGIEIATGLLADVEKRYGGEVALRTLAVEGAPADAILDVAEQQKADVIVVGNRGMTGAKRFVLGSVPNTISHHAPCHVLIVHTTDE